MAEEITPKEETLPEEEEFEPPVRSKEEIKAEQEPEEKKFWYALRQMSKEIKSLKSSQKDYRDDYKDDYKSDYGEDYHESREKELTPAYDNVIDSIDKRNAAVLAEIDKKERMREVKDFFRDNPEFKEYSAKIEKTALHPKFWDISVDFIAKGYAYDQAQKLGVEKSKQADDEAVKAKTGGSSFKPLEQSEKDYWELSDSEFEKEVNKAKSKGRE